MHMHMHPSGIALSPTVLYVGSYVDGTIFAYRRSSAELLATYQAAPRHCEFTSSHVHTGPHAHRHIGTQAHRSTCLHMPTHACLHCLHLTPSLTSSLTSSLTYSTVHAALFGLALETKAAGAEGQLYFLAQSQLHSFVLPPPDSPSACATPVDAADGCADSIINGEETDVDCGGRLCARCALGKTCAADSDCLSTSCHRGRKECVVATPFLHTPTMLEGYLNSSFYYTSFLHHAIHQVRCRMWVGRV